MLRDKHRGYEIISKLNCDARHTSSKTSESKVDVLGPSVRNLVRQDSRNILFAVLLELDFVASTDERRVHVRSPSRREEESRLFYAGNLLCENDSPICCLQHRQETLLEPLRDEVNLVDKYDKRWV